jgi:hypothetical protein
VVRRRALSHASPAITAIAPSTIAAIATVFRVAGRKRQ